ncbi:MAG: thioredoxin 1 [Actinoplanes sp.]|jgi:thioredoxin 1|nr:thioredoxin 1 [Actinoplanes sp.]
MTRSGSRLTTIRSEELREVLAENPFLVIIFFAEWCSPCRSFREVLDDAAEDNEDVTFAMVDVEKQPDLAAAFGVESVPKIAVIRFGAVVFAHEGALTDEAVDDVLGQVRDLDVDKLRRTEASQ